MRFEEKIRLFMRSQRMYKPGDRILAGISGGKDSMMLAVVLKYVTEIDDVYVDLIHLNFGQRGSEEIEQRVVAFAEDLGLPLRVWRLEEEWGMGFNEVLNKVGGNPCSLCSTLMRYYLLYEGRDYDAIATGHNLDDIVSFLLYNAATGNIRFSHSLKPVVKTVVGPLRIKPFFYIPEERIYQEARERSLPAIPTSCPSESRAPTVKIRGFLKEMEKDVPGIRKNLLKFFMSVNGESEGEPNRCKICGMPTSGSICKVCRIKMRLGILPGKNTHQM